jgi:N-acetylmuramoyl-L-alanine amidase
VVSGTAANIRSGPGTDYNVVSRAGQGDRLTLLEKSSDWYKVRLPDGNTGWIVAWLMEEEEPATTPGTGVQPPQGPTGGSGGVEGQYVPPSPPADKDNTGEKDNTGGKDNTGKTVSSGSLKSVSGKSGGNNSTVTVESDGTTIKYNLFYMSDRLVLDIQGLDPGKVPESITLNSMLVDKIRVGLFQSNPAVTRVVLDLKARVSCEESLSSGGNKLQLVLTPRGTGTVAGSKIVLDPGHGGSDPGAIGSNGLQEKTVNLDISLKVAQILRERGATVIMTRTGDTYVDLYERPEIANRNDADLFVSIHSNSTTRSDVAGTSTYYVRAPEAGMEEVAGEGKILAGDIQSCLMKALGRQDKGVLQANYVVLVKSKVPAALAEVAYLSNPEEVRLLGDSSFRLKAAQAIADGIEKYLKEN